MYGFSLGSSARAMFAFDPPIAPPLHAEAMSAYDSNALNMFGSLIRFTLS